MKRNVFLPEGSDFSRSEVDKEAESVKYEARLKLLDLRKDSTNPKQVKAKPQKAKSKEPKSYAEILKAVQKNKK